MLARNVTLAHGESRASLAIDGNAHAAGNRWTLLASRFQRADLPSKVAGDRLTTPAQLIGTFELAGKVVLDGATFHRCNEFSRQAFKPGQSAALVGSEVKVERDGYYAFTCDLKVMAGSPRFFLWSRDQHQWIQSLVVPSQGRWHTVGSLALAKVGQNFFLDVSGEGDCTWRMSAFQIHRFETKAGAQDFLASAIYAIKK